jgi:Zn-dependent peptidase ImmA (M78 family)/DNA-binding XRE family transcriptional regulator
VPTKALIKPALLVWTRNRAKVTLEDAAKAAGVEAEVVQAWEKGTDAPTLNKLRALAAKYHFPLAIFYLAEPPQDFAPLRDFRRLPDAEARDIGANLAYHIRNAYERRELALELYEDLREQARPFPLRARPTDNPENVGKAIREFLGIDADLQTRAARQQRAFDFWRRRLEDKNILVFVVSGPHYSVELKEMRGFAIAKDPLPVIVVNGRDNSQGGKVFTLLHELAHIILGESALSNGAGDSGTLSEERKIERFCDAVAAAAIMPRELVLSFEAATPTGERNWKEEVLGAMAHAIGVSREALIIRLITLRRATWDFYRRKADQYEEERRVAAEREDRRPAAIRRPILLMSWNGRGFTRLVLRSYYDRKITLNDVSSYLGAKVNHIPDLERAAFQGIEQ